MKHCYLIYIVVNRRKRWVLLYHAIYYCMCWGGGVECSRLRNIVRLWCTLVGI